MITFKNQIRFIGALFLLVLLIPGSLALAKSPMQENQATATPTLAATSDVAAPTATATPQKTRLMQTGEKIQLPDTAESLSFDDFGFEELVLRGPFASNGYFFDLPAIWKMKQGAELQLVLDIYYTGTQSNLHNSAYGGTLLVQYNYTTIAAIDLSREGSQTVHVPIPLNVINRPDNEKSQSLQFVLDSGVDCDVNFRTTVIVRSVSRLYLPHDLVDPPVDLKLLPVPFFQDSFNQDSVIIAISNQPTASELQAALSVSAGFGRMTYNRLILSLMPVSSVSPDMLKSSNIIFVGKASGLPLLEQVSLPVPLSQGKFSTKDISSTDGLVQMAISPWNKSKAIMAVTGNDDAAVINAARAVSTGVLRVGNNPSLSVISNVQTFASQYDLNHANRTFADLGYESSVVNSVGLNRLSYTFDVPDTYTLGAGANLDLKFSHSSLLEYQRSTVVVKLNDQPVGSVSLSANTASQGDAKVLLPASATRPGSNRLDLEINLEPTNECVNPLLNGLWMRIDSSSALYLPFVPNPASSSIIIDLSRYPAPFAFDPVMNDLAFVLPTNDPVSWNVAAHIAFALGNKNAIRLAGLNAFYADSIPDAVKQERNLIIVGKPSTLNVLSDLNNVLPASFEPGTNLAIEKNLQVSYHLSPGVDVGYLELLPSPWNSKRTILFVGGSSDRGVQWSGSVLQFGRLQSQLKGNLAFINDEQVITADTRDFQGQGALATASPDNVISAAEVQQPAPVEHPAWILPGIFTALGGILIILIILGVQAVLRKRSGK